MLRDWKRQRQWQIGGAEPVPELHEMYLENTRLRRTPDDLWPVLKPHVPPADELGEGESGVNRFGRQFLLPDPGEQLAGVSLSDALSRRRSSRDFGNRPLSGQDLSALMFATCGQTGTSAATADAPVAFYSTPSAGNLRSAVPYLILQETEDLGRGLDSFDAARQAVHLIQPLQQRADELDIFADPAAARSAAAIILVLGRFGKAVHKYGPRGSRYVFIDAGHMIQNTYLAATALGLRCCSGCDFHDDAANRLIGADGLDESVIYAAFIGT